jgi:ribosomal protein S27AE
MNRPFFLIKNLKVNSQKQEARLYMDNITVGNIIRELDKMFYHINDVYYKGGLIKPVIVVNSNGKERHTMGWCTLNAVWSNLESQEKYYEINVCSEFLYRDIKDIYATLMHECVHLYHVQNNIKDTSRGYTYHNKTFKSEAERIGLTVTHSERYGWAITAAKPEAITMLESLDIDKSVFKLTRGSKLDIDAGKNGGDSADGGGGSDESKKKQSYRKYVCPECGLIARTTKDATLICGECDMNMFLSDVKG